MTVALEVTVTAAVASFRNPLYAGVQVCLPCPPPATVGGMLAAAAGGWDHVPEATRFALSFSAEASGIDVETYHPLHFAGQRTEPTPRGREFLAGVTLTTWLLNDLDLWERALRRPVWPLRLGRSQDLAAGRMRRVQLVEVPGSQGTAVVPAELTGTGTLLRLPTAISLDRARTRWDAYRYAAKGSQAVVTTGLSDENGQAVAVLPAIHPAQFAARS